MCREGGQPSPRFSELPDLRTTALQKNPHRRLKWFRTRGKILQPDPVSVILSAIYSLEYFYLRRFRFRDRRPTYLCILGGWSTFCFLAQQDGKPS